MNIPDGWQLVPKTPTPEMIAAAKKACGFDATEIILKQMADSGMAQLNMMVWTGDIEYTAMLAAAPSFNDGQQP